MDMKIILDAMGGDNAPEAPVLGAVQAAKDFGAQIVLVGRGQEILETMRKNGINDLSFVKQYDSTVAFYYMLYHNFSGVKITSDPLESRGKYYVFG